ncbi:MAG: hypothetical protein DMG64_05360 [Acidobacteria bacterium]|nr:MAG: hypothetical protein DMG63_15095 [Acidobacteriota bacterium]PYY04161.1 MAG: hypothetical protein DMG64_05360 [Acidobacteriota bacterium]PYY23509.1 MAG: hypothetical protein DMG62_07525 [Acidobacteriota bacterium]
MATINNDHWVVAFPGSRDSYQVPIALNESGLLQSLVTDFYAPLDRPWFALASRFLPSDIKSKLSRRFDPELPSGCVASYPTYAIKNWWKPELWINRVGSLGKHAGSVATKEECSILAYAHVATSAFAAAGVRSKVLMQMQPHPASVRAALMADRFLPDFEDHSNNELLWAPDIFETFSREPLLADLCIVASTYTRRTLIENGVAQDRISVVPYGVDLDFFAAEQSRPRKLSMLFVGQASRQKGLHYLLEAWDKLRLPDAELQIVGHLPRNKNSLTKYASLARFLGPLDWRRLRDEYGRADLLCLPSLGDGFGQVVLEALACGTPVLTTSSCGASDLIRGGENGFVIPPANLEALIASLEWASRNRDKLRQMRATARSTAEKYSWTIFRRRIVAELQSLTPGAFQCAKVT